MREIEEVMSLQDYIRVLHKRKWTIFTGIITVFLAVLIANFFMSPVYKATTTILISQSGTQQAIFGGADANLIVGRADEVETQIEILKSYSIAKGAAERLPADIFEKARVENIEKKKENYRWLINILDKLGLKNFIDSILGVNNHDHSNKDELSLEDTIKQIRGSVTVDSVRDTNIIEISSENNNPKLAAEIANTIAAVFVDKSLIVNRSKASEVKKFIEEQLLEKEKELSEEEEEKLQYKKQENILYLDEETKMNIEQLANFQAQEAEVNTQIAENKLKLIKVRKQLEKQSETYIASEMITTNPVVRQLQSELVSLEIQLPTLLEKYSKGSPQVMEVEIRIRETKNKISEKVAEIVGSKVSTRNPNILAQIYQIVTLETNTISLDTKREAISKTIKEYENRLEKLPDKELHLARLERAVRVSENIYLLLLEKHQEARINEVMELGDIRVIDQALIPEAPIKPNKKLNLAIGGILGLMLGVMLVFFMEYMDNTIKNTEDVERILNLPILGVIPKNTPEKKKKRKRKHQQPKRNLKTGERQPKGDSHA